MNVVFISPHFPEYYHNFCSRLKDRGVNVLGVGDCPYDMISDETKNSLTEYYYVGSLENYDEVYRACAYFSSQYGKIDWIESENEYWLELEATLRRDFNVTTGPQIQDMRWMKFKSAMKEVYKSAGLKVADYIKLDTLDEALEFTKKNGYPVIVKPDNGVGATHTYKLKDDEELKDFYNHKQDYIDYILEDFVPGDVVTFEGVTDKDKNILFSTSHYMDTSIMDTVNDASDIYFHSEPVEGKPIYEIGEKVVKAFDTTSRFFHFEFIKLSEDKSGLGRKGDLVPLEVNMRAPGAFIPDMMNYAYDVDTYTIWADMMIYNTCFYEIERKYYVGYVGRRLGIDYELSDAEVADKYREYIKIEADIPQVLAQAEGNHIFIFRAKTKAKLNEITKAIIAHKKKKAAPKKAVKKTVKAVVEETVKTVEKKKEPVKKTVKAVAKKVEEVKEPVKTVVEEAVKTVEKKKEPVKKTVKAVTKKVEETKEPVKAVVETKKEEVKAAVEDTVKVVEEKKEELKEVVKKSPRARKAVKKPRHKAKKR